jgi:hypothetical protein
MTGRVSTDELFARWRRAERTASRLDRNSPEWIVARRLANEAWNAYERRLDEDRPVLPPDAN